MINPVVVSKIIVINVRYCTSGGCFCASPPPTDGPAIAGPKQTYPQPLLGGEVTKNGGYVSASPR